MTCIKDNHFHIFHNIVNVFEEAYQETNGYDKTREFDAIRGYICHGILKDSKTLINEINLAVNTNYKTYIEYVEDDDDDD